MNLFTSTFCVNHKQDFINVFHYQIDFEDLGYTGPDHGRTYSFRVVSGELIFDCGCGRSKKHAKQEAAKIALKELLGIEFETGKNNTAPFSPLPLYNQLLSNPVTGSMNLN